MDLKEAIFIELLHDCLRPQRNWSGGWDDEDHMAQECWRKAGGMHRAIMASNAPPSSQNVVTD